MVMPKVLLVDDDPDFVRIHKAYLEHAGFQVTASYSGEEGISAALADKPNVVVLDYMMDRPTEGSFVALEFKENPRLRDIPILLVTSVRSKHPWWGVKQSDAYLPVEAILDKPVSPEKLVAEVSRLMEHRG